MPRFWTARSPLFSGSQNSASGSGHAIRPHRGEHPRCRRPGAMVRVLDAAHRFGLWHLGRRRRDRHHGRVLARPEPLHPGRGALRHGVAAQHLQLREAHGGGSGRRLPPLRPGVGRAGDPLVRGRDALPHRQELDLLELLQGCRDERARRRLRLGAVRPAVPPAAQSRGGRKSARGSHARRASRRTPRRLRARLRVHHRYRDRHRLRRLYGLHGSLRHAAGARQRFPRGLRPLRRCGRATYVPERRRQRGARLRRLRRGGPRSRSRKSMPAPAAW